VYVVVFAPFDDPKLVHPAIDEPVGAVTIPL
jgi:hypothetical protein